MNKLKVSISAQDKSDELLKALSFASKEIIDIEVFDEYLEILVEEEADLKVVETKVNKILSKHKKNGITNDEIIEFESNNSIESFTSYKQIEDSGFIVDYGNGLVSLKDKAIILYRYFNNIFRNFALELEGVEKRYPTLLPMNYFKKTGYLRTSPQYSIFCSSVEEDIDNLEELHRLSNKDNLKQGISEPNLVLSPSACFHSYMEYEGEVLDNTKVLTFVQNVFRHEGRLNWNDFGRLKDYNVREIVFLGDIEFVLDCREKMINKTKDFVNRLGLNSRLCVTFDPFVVPSMQKFKKIQLKEKNKYEMQLAYSNDDYLAVSSFNLHGTAFTSSFNIKIKDVDTAVTGCVGFGIERWVLAFITQYGVNTKKWPEEVKKEWGDKYE